MEMKNLLGVLEFIGLSKKEATVYLALLRLGSGVAGTIAKETRIPRATTYQILDKLCDLGLAMKIDKDNILTYMPESPTRISLNLTKERERSEKKGVLFESILPELERMRNGRRTLPKITYFEGVNGYLELLRKVLITESREMLMITNSKHEKLHSNDEVKLEEIVRFENREFLEQRLRKRISLRLLTYGSSSVRTLRETDDEELRETREIPEGFGDVETMVITGNKVILVTDNHPVVGVFMEEDQMSHMMRNFFEFLWKHTREPQ